LKTKFARSVRVSLEVRFIEGSKLRGWIGKISDSGFILSHENKRRLANSQLAFNQLRSVKP
jgi:hypothetical protein